ncbi:hypothetical protein [Aeromonas sanarellii]|uniref:hypothetical protein n=1 Tax=Aeromonas sanarellii TaxID=633415 RepID=UPI003BA34293
MHRMAKVLIKGELKALLFTWPIFPIICLYYLIMFLCGKVDVDTQVCWPIEWVTMRLLDIDRADFLFSIVFPLLLIVWIINKYARPLRKERAKLRKIALCIWNAAVNIFRVLSGACFGIWLFSFAPELGGEITNDILYFSLLNLMISVIFSIGVRLLVNNVITNGI